MQGRSESFYIPLCPSETQEFSAVQISDISSELQVPDFRVCSEPKPVDPRTGKGVTNTYLTLQVKATQFLFRKNQHLILFLRIEIFMQREIGNLIWSYNLVGTERKKKVKKVPLVGSWMIRLCILPLILASSMTLHITAKTVITIFVHCILHVENS